MIWWILAFALAAMAVIVWNSRITAVFAFKRMHNDDRLTLHVKALFGLLRYQYVIPSIRFQGFVEGLLIKSKQNTTGIGKFADDEQHIDLHKIMDYVHNAKVLVAHAEGFSDWMTAALSYWKITRLKWYTHIGLGDAPQTAVASGLLWGMKSSVLGFIFKYVQYSSKPDLSVAPQYNQMHFSTDILCIGRIGAGRALIAGIRLLMRIWKVEGGMKVWQSILFKKTKTLNKA